MAVFSDIRLILKKINELNPFAGTVLSGEELIPIYDPATGRTVKVKTSLFTGGEDKTLQWVSTETYVTDEIRTWNLKFWKSLVDANIRNQPVEGTYWTEVSKSETGNLGYWAAGVFTNDPSYAVYNQELYLLDNTKVTIPYESSDFETELSENKWVLQGGAITASSFIKNLTTADDTIQKIADRLDKMPFGLEWQYNSAAFVSDLTAGQFQFNADKTILYLSYVLNPNVGLSNTIQNYVEGIKSGSKFIFRDSTGKVLEAIATGDAVQGGSAANYATIACTVLNDSGIGNGLNCVVEIAGVGGGAGLTPEQAAELAAATEHIDGVDEEKHGSEQITNAAALSNIETAANAKSSTILGNINARLFEQIGFVVVGQGIDAIAGKTYALTSLPYAFKAYVLRVDYEVAPTGSSAIITFYKNGVSIGTVTVLSGAFFGSTTLGSVVSFAIGDSLRATVTQEGATITGQCVNVYIQGIKYQ